MVEWQVFCVEVRGCDSRFFFDVTASLRGPTCINEKSKIEKKKSYVAA